MSGAFFPSPKFPPEIVATVNAVLTWVFLLRKSREPTVRNSLSVATCYINFSDDKSGQPKQVIVQVKSAYIGVNHVRDLKGVLDREKAPSVHSSPCANPPSPCSRKPPQQASTSQKTFHAAIPDCKSSPLPNCWRERNSNTPPTVSKPSPKRNGRAKTSRTSCSDWFIPLNLKFPQLSCGMCLDRLLDIV